METGGEGEKTKQSAKEKESPFSVEGDFLRKKKGTVRGREGSDLNAFRHPREAKRGWKKEILGIRGFAGWLGCS